jgi:hypothetical protein
MGCCKHLQSPTKGRYQTISGTCLSLGKTQQWLRYLSTYFGEQLRTPAMFPVINPCQNPASPDFISSTILLSQHCNLMLSCLPIQDSWYYCTYDWSYIVWVAQSQLQVTYYIRIRTCQEIWPYPADIDKQRCCLHWWYLHICLLKYSRYVSSLVHTMYPSSCPGVFGTKRLHMQVTLCTWGYVEATLSAAIYAFSVLRQIAPCWQAGKGALKITPLETQDLQ